MSTKPNLLICGASARAAAFSALRAGLRPWCVDLFGDADLKRCCPAQAIPSRDYPEGLARVLIQEGPPGPWMYTGGLENHPRVISTIARVRDLWGIDLPAASLVRWPEELLKRVREGVCSLPEFRSKPGDLPPDGSWLHRRVWGSGGAGIRPWLGPAHAGRTEGPTYYQKRVAGLSCSAVFIGDGRDATLLGVTRQLVGETWLNARPFAYCGSLGPLRFAATLRKRFTDVGNILTREFGLRGLFGTDCIVDGDTFWLIEVNPRYTASIEVLEYATGVAALALHRRAFVGESSEPVAPSRARREGGEIVGKAVLFARRSLSFPWEGPWLATLERPFDPWSLPAFADIPAPGTQIAPGWPILSFLVRGPSVDAVEGELRRHALILDRQLHGR